MMQLFQFPNLVTYSHSHTAVSIPRYSIAWAHHRRRIYFEQQSSTATKIQAEHQWRRQRSKGAEVISRSEHPRARSPGLQGRIKVGLQAQTRNKIF